MVSGGVNEGVALLDVEVLQFNMGQLKMCLVLVAKLYFIHVFKRFYSIFYSIVY